MDFIKRSSVGNRQKAAASKIISESRKRGINDVGLNKLALNLNKLGNANNNATKAAAVFGSAVGAGSFVKSSVSTSPLASKASSFLASSAGATAIGRKIVEKQKEQGVGFDLDLGGTLGGGAGGGSTTQGTSDKILAWIKENFVWVLVIIGGVILLPFLIGFMRKSSTKRIPSRKKPISPVRRKSSYAGKSMSTRAKQLAALARGRAKRLRNLRSKKK